MKCINWPCQLPDGHPGPCGTEACPDHHYRAMGYCPFCNESLSGGNPGQPTACTTAEEGGIEGATGAGQLPADNAESARDSAERRSPASIHAAGRRTRVTGTNRPADREDVGQ